MEKLEIKKMTSADMNALKMIGNRLLLIARSNPASSTIMIKPAVPNNTITKEGTNPLSPHNIALPCRLLITIKPTEFGCCG